MKNNLFIVCTLFITILTTCQKSTPPPITAAQDVEFTLAADQTAMLTDIGMTIKLISVAGDERCPSEIECAMSGPVSISLSVQISNGEPANIDLQTFTDNNGHAPDTYFVGVKDREVFEGYSIRVTVVLPYPTNLTDTIKDSEYRVTLVVSKKP